MKFLTTLALALVCVVAQAQTLPLPATLVESSDPLASGGVSQLEWDGDGRRVFCGWNGSSYPGETPGAIDVWDVKTKKRLRRFRPKEGGELVAFGVSRDTKRIAANFSGGGWRRRSEADPPWPNVLGRVCVWNIASGRLLSEWATPRTRLYGFAFAPDGKSVAAGGGDNSVHLWRVGREKELWIRRGQTGGWIQGLAFSRDGARIYALRHTSDNRARDKGLSVLTTKTGQARVVLTKMPTDFGSHLALAPSENAIFAGGASNGINGRGRGDACLALPSGRVLWIPRTLTKRAAFSSDGRFVALNGEYGDGQVRRFRNGHVVFSLVADGNTAGSALAFSPDSKRVAVVLRTRPPDKYAIRFYALPRG